jgi:hypothetical protein
VIPETLMGIPETLICPGAVMVFVVEVGNGAVVTGIVGVVGSAVANPTLPTIGDTLAVGIAAAELTPRLAISQEPSGIPVLGLPPGVVGVVEVGVVGDVAMSPELNPHKPDTPIVPMPEDVDIPEIGSNPGSSDVAVVWLLPDAEMVSDIVAVPAVAPVAVVVDPIAIPPPSYVLTDPMRPDGEVPNVVHVVPLPGNATVPVE